LTDLIDELFDEAYLIKESERDLIERRRVNRTSLRHLKEAGKLDEDQAAHLEELYPTIKRPRNKTTETTERHKIG
jgi:ribosomal protein L19E